MMHNAHEQNQNLGNRVGDRPCVGQNKFSREQDSGNAMKGILGQTELTWNTDSREGVFGGQRVRDVEGAGLTAKIGGRPNGFYQNSRKSKDAEITTKITTHRAAGGLENSDPRMYYPQEQQQDIAGAPPGYVPQRATRTSGQQLTQKQMKERGANGNPLSWDDSDQWQTTSSANGGFYSRRG